MHRYCSAALITFVLCSSNLCAEHTIKLFTLSHSLSVSLSLFSLSIYLSRYNTVLPSCTVSLQRNFSSLRPYTTFRGAPKIRTPVIAASAKRIASFDITTLSHSVSVVVPWRGGLEWKSLSFAAPRPFPRPRGASAGAGPSIGEATEKGGGYARGKELSSKRAHARQAERRTRCTGPRRRRSQWRRRQQRCVLSQFPGFQDVSAVARALKADRGRVACAISRRIPSARTLQRRAITTWRARAVNEDVYDRECSLWRAVRICYACFCRGAIVIARASCWRFEAQRNCYGRNDRKRCNTPMDRHDAKRIRRVRLRLPIKP